jgi:hypothetical protein
VSLEIVTPEQRVSKRRYRRRQGYGGKRHAG